MDLKELFEEVRKFREEKFKKMNMPPLEQQHTMVPLTKLVEEVGELVQLHNTDYWLKRNVTPEEYAEEIVDILFFIVDVCDRQGVTVEMIEETFKMKLEKNFKRFDSRGVFI